MKDKTKYHSFYSHSKAETITNKSDIDNIFEPINATVISYIQKSSGKVSGWNIDFVIKHHINILKYNFLAGSSYIRLRKKIDHSRKRLIYIQNIDCNECFK